jgi:hypothetical protein
MPQALHKNISLVGTILISGATMIGSALPCLAQTVIQATVINPTIVTPVANISPTNFNSQATSRSQSSHSCFQVDANSKIFVRDTLSGIRYYPTNSSSSYAKIMKDYPRCD